MSKTAELLTDLVEAAEYDFESIRALIVNNPETRGEDGRLLRQVQASYQELIGQLHVAISAMQRVHRGPS